jgi:hypothetical protein
MEHVMNQRWLFGRDSYRPPSEVIRTADYEVAPIPEGAAKAFVVEHHYSRSYPAARFRFGLHRHGDLVGVAVFSVPMCWEVLKPLPGPPLASVELGRFVLLDDVPGNGETWFLGRCFDGLRQAGLRGVVSFSDPVPRETVDGRRVFAGHVGTIYQAHNAVYLGRATPRTLRLLPDGRVLSDRAISKIRQLERGHAYSSALLEQFGAAPLGGQEPRAWLSHWLPRLTRTMRHPGAFKYAWALTRSDRKALPASLPYPKAHGMVAL